MKAALKMTAVTDKTAMESLALPQDLYWDGKTEPISPLSIELFSMTEPAGFWLNDDNIENGITMVSDKDFELKSGMELFNGDDIVFEFSDFKEEWSENKLLLDVDTAIAHPNPVTKVHDSFDIEALKSENFEIAVLTTLTPPQSPPQSSTSATLLQNGIATEGAINVNNVLQLTPSETVSQVPPTALTSSQIHYVPSPALTPAPSTLTLHSLHFTPYYNSAPFTPTDAAQTDDDKRNSQIVDEFLKSCIKELPNLNDDCESMSWSSYSSGSRPDSIVTDEEWSPDSSFSSSASSSPMYNGDEDNSQSMVPKSSEPKKRTRPYGRGVEDRKMRKKEQNKNAATRYRQKKKVEMENVLNEEQKLTQRNEELKRVLAERQREAKYLKTLIKEFYKKKKDSKQANA
ncbi:PREDICTED: cyclic AMP-dependent transcription factor ATF-4 isoform X2 [Rhagoletis zephyria]|uniref:cyclic AMP-dependent transcription factor ATF-4 isoform X2 n=1 Tax=Rhagoletis zephyria TaxID=28612 RepID=UPI000811A825|nr:PREDICTED: cyclic AMP-dependent transcription factor ATF-4 isoform X2 [Rhagoletis zephyria]